MANEETLAALLSGAFSNRAPADLEQFGKTISQNNLYNMAAAPIMQTKFDTSTWSPTQKIASAFLQSFLGNSLAEYGRKSDAEQIAKVNQVLPQLYNDPSSVAIPEGVDRGAFEALRATQINKRAALNDSVQDYKRKQEAVQDLSLKPENLKNSVMKELFSKRPDLALEYLKKGEAALTTEPDAQTNDTLTIEQNAEMPSLATGKQSTAKKIIEYTKEFQKTMPPVQAAAAARLQVEGEIKANNKSFDDAKEAREYGQKMLDLASTARAGLAKAGTTGSFNTARSALDSVASFFGSEASTETRTGDQILSSIAPEVIKMSRAPGAVSDYESKLYLGSAPGVNQTPETNAILIKKMEDIGKLNLDYADFLEAFKEANAGSTAGANRKWAEYKNKFPFFTQDGKELNENRPSWQEYFGGRVDASSSQDLSGYSAAQIEFMKKKGLL